MKTNSSNNMQSESWWDSVDLTLPTEDDTSSWYLRAQFKRACKEKGWIIYEDNRNGSHADISREDLINELIEAGADPIVLSEGDFGGSTFLIEDGILVVVFERSYHRTSCVGTNHDIVRKFSEMVSKHYVAEPPQGSIKMLISTSQGLQLTTLGVIDSPLEEDNYTKENVEAFEFLTKDLVADKPTGRLIILDGPPGTGKSFFIKALISEITAWVVFVPSTLIGQLSGPQLAGILFTDREGRKQLPLILILEDADISLMKRDGNTVGNLSDLLNMSDGISGEMANIRCIATTNAKIDELDEALLRPGRLSRRLEFDKLSLEQTRELYQKLSGGKGYLGQEPLTLAEIYAKANGTEYISPPRKNIRRLGFGHDSKSETNKGTESTENGSEPEAFS